MCRDCPAGARDDLEPASMGDGPATAQIRESRSPAEHNMSIICILCVRRLITMMVKTVIGMTI